VSGSELLAGHTAGGLIRSVWTTTTLNLPTSGEVQLDVATVERRYGLGLAGYATKTTTC